MSRADRILIGARAATIAVLAIGAAGAAGAGVDWATTTATLGPTAYVFAAHPSSATARLRNALIGHSVAIIVALACLAATGMWNRSPAPPVHGPGVQQVISAAAAVGLTLVVLELLDAHHAPAASTTLLVATGLAGPVRPLLGLTLGLAIVVALGPLATRVPWGRRLAARRASTSNDL